MNILINFVLFGLPPIGFMMLIASVITEIQWLKIGLVLICLPIMIMTVAILKHKGKNDTQ